MESENEVPQKRRCRLAEEPGFSHVNKLGFCWFTEYDDETNLQDAGQRLAKTKPNSEHVKTSLVSGKKWLQLSNTSISCVR